MVLTPELRARYHSKIPEDRVEEIIQELITESDSYQEALTEAIETAKLWKVRYQKASKLIDATSMNIADQLATQLQLIVNQVKPKFNNQKRIFDNARMALEAYNQHKSKEPK